MEYSASSISNNNDGKASVHVLVLPFPSIGHLSPTMQLVHRLADHGVMITILTIDGTHTRRLVKEQSRNEINIVTVPDGLETEDERRDEMKVLESFFEVMPDHTFNFVRNVNQQQDFQEISCVISDIMNVWSLEIVSEMGLKMALFYSPAIGCMATCLNISKLFEDGLVDAQGSPNNNKEILLSPYLPELRSSDYPWIVPGNLLLQEMFFQLVSSYEQYHRCYDWVLGNWFQDLDPSIDDSLPNILSVGPLIANGRSDSESLWSRDMSCLSWLDKQPPRSVIYVAFGSTGKKSQQQFDELALGLELVGKPFIWVVKTDPSNGVSANYPDGFQERVANQGMMVEWAPQEKVLAHPSVACFLNHAGWNSVMESISYGIPMLCWPHMADHFYNRTCICNGWKIGLELKPDDNGIVTRHQLKLKVEELLSNTGIRSNALKLKSLAQKSISKGGSSSKNLEYFVAQLKQLNL